MQHMLHNLFLNVVEADGEINAREGTVATLVVSRPVRPSTST